MRSNGKAVSQSKRKTTGSHVQLKISTRIQLIPCQQQQVRKKKKKVFSCNHCAIESLLLFSVPHTPEILFLGGSLATGASGTKAGLC